MTQHNQLTSLLASDSGQSDFKSFLQGYHQRLNDKHGIPNVKLGNALHAAAESLGYESWHHAVNGSNPTPCGEKSICGREIWTGRHWEGNGGGFGVFETERGALLSIAHYVVVRILEVGEIDHDAAYVEELIAYEEFDYIVEYMSHDFFLSGVTDLIVNDLFQNPAFVDRQIGIKRFFINLLFGLQTKSIDDKNVDVILEDADDCILYTIIGDYFDFMNDDIVSAGFFVQKEEIGS